MLARAWPLLLYFELVFSGNITDLQRLKINLLTGYDKTLRPVVNQSNAIQVNITFYIGYLSELDERKSKLSISGVLFVFWYDELLKWTPADYGDISQIVLPIDDVWYPPLIIGNDFNALGEATQDWGTVRYSHNGFAAMYPGNVFHVVCTVSALYFPFDNQTCDVSMGTWGYMFDEIYIYSPEKVIPLTYYEENGEWEITGTKSASILTSSGDGYITFTMYLKRKPMFLFVNMVLPILFMSVLALLVFLLPVEAGERMSFIITVLLAVAVFLTIVSDNLPRTSSPMPLICIYLLLSMTITTLICLMTVINLKIYFLEDNKTSMPNWCKKMTIKLNRIRSKRNDRGDGNQIQPMSDGMGDVLKEKPPPLDEEAKDITWKEFSSAVDKLSLIIFSGMLLFVTALFMGMLVAHTPM